MKRMIRTLAVMWLMLLLVMPVVAQEPAPDIIPTAEAAVAIEEPTETEGNSVLDWMRFIIENDLHWYIFALIGLLVAGNLVPESVIKERKAEAKKTETPVDDGMVALLEAAQMIKQFLAGTNTALTPNPVPAAVGTSYVEELRRLNTQPTIVQNPVVTMEVVRQPLNVAVNRNPILDNVKSGDWGDEAKRAKDTPDGYSLAWQPLMAGDAYAPPPETHRQDTGLELSLAHRRGRLFIHQDVSGLVLAGQRYLLAVRCQCDLKLKPDANIKGAIAIKGQLLSGEAVIRNLVAWSPETVEDLADGFEAMWAIEAGRAYQNLSYQVLVEVGNIHAVPFDEQSRLVITTIELMPVAADYGNENLVRI